MVKTIVPNGFYGRDCGDSILTGILRNIAEIYGCDNDFPEKYGANVDNDIFTMHRYCWCEKDNCPYCREIDRLPNFHHKKSGLKIWWYKYIGRGEECNMSLSLDELIGIYKEIVSYKNKGIENE